MTIELALLGASVVLGSALHSDTIIVGWTNRILVTTFVLWLVVAAIHVLSRS